jgi:hypothetical protein
VSSDQGGLASAYEGGLLAQGRELASRREEIAGDAVGRLPGRRERGGLTSHAELAVRHPRHDSTDFARPAPERWQRPPTWTDAASSPASTAWSGCSTSLTRS